MAETKVIGRVIFLIIFLSSAVSCAPTYMWHDIAADSHRTGVVPVTASNMPQALGYVDGGMYHAPSGEVFEEGTCTEKLAEILISAQPEVDYLKKVIAYSPRSMEKHRPQSELSNFTVDCMMEKVEEITGRKVDVGITNFGGIRCAVPKGDVILDDIVAMFPFKNNLVYVVTTGERLREIFADMVSRRVEVVGGVELIIKGGELMSFKVGGEDVVSDKLYGVASVDFLLKGGDGIFLADGAIEVVDTGMLIRDAILDKIGFLTAHGLPLEYHLDNRVIVVK